MNKKYLVVIISAFILLSSCLPSRTPTGDYWPSWDVYHCVLAGKKDARDHQLECPKKP